VGTVPRTMRLGGAFKMIYHFVYTVHAQRGQRPRIRRGLRPAQQESIPVRNCIAGLDLVPGRTPLSRRLTAGQWYRPQNQGSVGDQLGLKTRDKSGRLRQSGWRLTRPVKGKAEARGGGRLLYPSGLGRGWRFSWRLSGQFSMV
jgi:hypothetical protein